MSFFIRILFIAIAIIYFRVAMSIINIFPIISNNNIVLFTFIICLLVMVMVTHFCITYVINRFILKNNKYDFKEWFLI